MSGYCLQLGQYRFLTYPFQFIIHCHPVIRRYVLSGTTALLHQERTAARFAITCLCFLVGVFVVGVERCASCRAMEKTNSSQRKFPFGSPHGDVFMLRLRTPSVYFCNDRSVLISDIF
jgi:hypothetical protein